MTSLSKKFPHRVTWTEPRQKAALWLKDEFRALGYEPHGMNFSETIAGTTHQNLENIWAEKRGTRFPNEIIVVAAHYDITDTTVEGAADDASGVGVVLELARLYKNIQPQRTILFLLTDSEEFGAFWGARAFARQFDRVSQIVGVANFDFIAPRSRPGFSPSVMDCNGDTPPFGFAKSHSIQSEAWDKSKQKTSRISRSSLRVRF